MNEQRSTRLPASDVWSRYGVSVRTGNRWLKDKSLAFPRPMVINGRYYFFLDELEEWERSRGRATA